MNKLSEVAEQHIAGTTDRTTRTMFVLSLIFLSLIAVLISTHISLDPLTANSGAQSATIVALIQQLQNAALLSLLVIWPLFMLEQMFTRSKRSLRKRVAICLVPPLRLATVSAEHGNCIWLPWLGWQQPGRALSKRLERNLSKPMLVVALLILPVLLIEFGMAQLLRESTALRLLLHAATGLIWLAFTIEFIIMVAATDRKLGYVKAHWIDLAIIILPLISFLRSIRVLKLARIARLQQVAKMTRVYRMRGLMIKTMRALMLLEVFHRLLGGNQQRKLTRLKQQYQDQLEDLQELKAEIDDLEAELGATVERDEPQLAAG